MPPVRIYNQENSDFQIEKWGHRINILKDELTTPVVNSFILWRIYMYNSLRFTDYDLWELFRDDFDGWKKEHFDKAEKEVTTNLRNFLRQNGVFVMMKSGALINQELCNVVENPNYHEWTYDEIQQQLNRNGIFNSSQNPSVKPIQHEPNNNPQFFVTPRNQSSSPQVQHLPSAYEPNQTPKVENFFTNQQHQVHIPDSDGTVTKELTALMRSYSEGQKYGGGEDVLHLKLKIFYNICGQCGLPPSKWSQGFSIMLKGNAEIFFYNTLSGKGYNLEKLIEATRAHFETEQRRQEYLSIWSAMDLNKTIRTYPEKKQNGVFRNRYRRAPTNTAYSWSRTPFRIQLTRSAVNCL